MATSLVAVFAGFAILSWLAAVIVAIRLWRSIPRGKARMRLIWHGMDWFRAGTFRPKADADQRRLRAATIAFFLCLLAAALIGITLATPR